MDLIQLCKKYTFDLNLDLKHYTIKFRVNSGHQIVRLYCHLCQLNIIYNQLSEHLQFQAVDKMQ